MKKSFSTIKSYLTIIIFLPLLTACFSQKTALKNNTQIQNIVKSNAQQSQEAQASMAYKETTAAEASEKSIVGKSVEENVLVPSKKIQEDAVVSANAKTTPKMSKNTTWLVEKTVKKVERKSIKDKAQNQKNALGVKDADDKQASIQGNLLIGLILIIVGLIFAIFPWPVGIIGLILLIVGLVFLLLSLV